MDIAPVCPACGKPVVTGAPQGLCPECLMKSGFETRSANDPVGVKAAFVPPPVEELAKLFPQLEIIALLGQGGMGAVYKARQPRLDRFIALKILSPEKQNDPQFAERFQREARALAALTHPNIVTVYDFGEVQGIFYLLMEFVDGLTLRQLYQTRKLSPLEALGIVPQICDALQYAHEQGIVHRDIKPENILLDKKGRVKIADFGLAKILDPDPKDLSLTDAREVVGTPHYMAPEQFEKPLAVDCRADIYSLGVVFYEMLTGELPLGKFPPPSQKIHLDVRLDAVVLHALEKEPSLRFQKASDVKTAVETIAATPDAPIPPLPQGTPPVPAPLPSPVQPAGGSRAVMIALVAVGVIACVALACVAVLFLLSRNKLVLIPAVTKVSPAVSIVSSNLLNDDQRLVAQYIQNKFRKYDDARTFAGWPDQERTNLEKRLIDTLKGPELSDSQRDEHCQAINTLATMRSTNALPVLQAIASQPGQKLLRVEISNRRRWMAIRALATIGDRSSVPQIIPLLYHNNPYVRWSAQIALVQLTRQNFGKDWQAWGKWWNSQNGRPPFNPEIVKWWRGQAEPDELAANLAADDLKFFQSIRGQPPSATEVTFESRDFSISGHGFTIETLAEGTPVFSNRKFLWQEIPEKFRGCEYTRIQSGSKPVIRFRAKHDALLQFLSTIDQPGLNLAAWNPTDIQFHCDGEKTLRLFLFEKRIAAGTVVTVPQANWTGSLVLLPDLDASEQTPDTDSSDK